MLGRIHSIETCGTVDGPGIRYIIFLQGCPLRCKYCHNPDTWKYSGGKEMSADELFNDIITYKPFMIRSGGGVTVSGGEPLKQAEFILELFKKLKNAGIHTCVDTSGYIYSEKVKEVLAFTDLVLLDIKVFDPVKFKKLTGVELDNTLRFFNYLNKKNIDVWVRYVLVPNLTDDPRDITNLATFLEGRNNLKRIEVLPFHKMGEYKWNELGYKYELASTNEPTKADILNALSILKAKNLNVSMN